MSNNKEIILEDQFSSDTELDDEADESSTDVDAKLEDVFDVEFFKCYSALKKKDEKIYDQNVKFFHGNDTESADEDEGDSKESDSIKRDSLCFKSREPKMTLLDHQLALNPEEIEEPSMYQAKVDLNKEVAKSFYEKELDEIKKSIEKVGEGIDSESDNDLLIVKGQDDKKKTNDRLNYILDKIEDQEDEDLQHLKKVWNNPVNLSEEDRFLRDYILNKRYLPNSVAEDDDADDEDDGDVFFSKNIEDLSDADDDKEDEKARRQVALHHSDEKDFDKIARIPRNSTKTIRDLVEKQEKREKRSKKIEKMKKKKKALKDADCEDIVGDVPTKFHYRETEPNDYGLTAEELLLATDEELDKWVSLRDCIAYKTPDEEKSLKEKFLAKRDDIELKKKIFTSIYGDSADQTDGQADQSNLSSQSTTKRQKLRNKKRKRNLDSESSFKESANNSLQDDAQGLDRQAQEAVSNRQRKKKNRKRGIKHKKFAKIGVAPDRLLSYGISKTKLKRSKIL